MRSGQKVYRVFNIRTLKYFKKNSSYGGGKWVFAEEKASVWNGIGPLKNAFNEGSLRGEDWSDIQVLEYEITFTRGTTTPALTFLKG